MSSAILAARRKNKAERVEKVGRLARGKFVSAANVPQVLKRIIESGDIVCLEGDNQKQADFLANQLAALGPKDLRDLHLVMSCITLPAHIQLFKQGMLRHADFCYAVPHGTAVADLVMAKKLPIGAFHTYN